MSVPSLQVCIAVTACLFALSASYQPEPEDVACVLSAEPTADDCTAACEQELTNAVTTPPSGNGAACGDLTTYACQPGNGECPFDGAICPAGTCDYSSINMTSMNATDSGNFEQFPYKPWPAEAALLSGDIGTNCDWINNDGAMVALASGENLWWQVDLAHTHAISEVRVRGTSLTGYSDNVNVSVCTDSDGNSCTQCACSDVCDDHVGLCDVPTNDWAVANCDGVPQGRYVRLERAGVISANWHFCRVEVEGYEIPDPGNCECAVDCVMGSEVGPDDCTFMCGTLEQAVLTAPIGQGAACPAPQTHTCAVEDGTCYDKLTSSQDITVNSSYTYAEILNYGDTTRWPASDALLDGDECDLTSQCEWDGSDKPSVALFSGQNLWWEVNLGYPNIFYVTEVRIRGISIAGLSDGVQVSVCDSGDESVSGDESNSGDSCTPCEGPVDVPANEWVSVDCGVEGSWVRLATSSMNSANWHFCRVEAYGIYTRTENINPPGNLRA